MIAYLRPTGKLTENAKSFRKCEIATCIAPLSSYIASMLNDIALAPSDFAVTHPLTRVVLTSLPCAFGHQSYA